VLMRKKREGQRAAAGSNAPQHREQGRALLRADLAWRAGEETVLFWLQNEPLFNLGGGSPCNFDWVIGVKSVIQCWTWRSSFAFIIWYRLLVRMKNKRRLYYAAFQTSLKVLPCFAEKPRQTLQVHRRSYIPFLGFLKRVPFKKKSCKVRGLTNIFYHISCFKFAG
jgi:hypothetical protein